jgi:hypothetical protein
MDTGFAATLRALPGAMATKAGVVLLALGLTGAGAFGFGLAQVFFTPSREEPAGLPAARMELEVKRSASVARSPKDRSLSMLSRANSGELSPEGAQRRRFYQLDELAEDAYREGDYEKAQLLAQEFLDLALSYKSDWNYGNAVHNGHDLLGRIALKAGDRKKAAEELLLAGQSPGSPQLDTFGPKMNLARELLGKGERTAVQEYLRLCLRFWKNPCAASWLSELEQGGSPILVRSFCRQGSRRAPTP